MTAFNFRSLLLAAIVLSNCITWTASRHHYAHNVHQHRTRHRRQGAGLYLPASYVIPGGEGGGPWGDWGEVSACSRTCGGGVASQKRICLTKGSDGQPQCWGGDTKYFSCQTQDCPAGSGDFRAEQCAEFDDQAFRGFKYNWVPYTKAPKVCELNCMPHGERFYFRHREQVVDGTRCNDESFDVCVNGTCQPVGCDMMLGSNAREDKCRECRGNGANCRTTAGIFNSQDLMKGYNDVFLIPEGSTTIIIEEVEPSNNYLALRSKNGTYYLNGHYHIDFPRSILIAGALWTYERSQQGYAAPDKLRCIGPTNEPLYLSLLLQDENVGIRYEYSVPNNTAPPSDKRYNWVHEEFTPCSATCGGGFQIRNVTCRSREELEIVDDSLCDEGLKPPTNRTCSPDPCPAQWVEGPWGNCSKRCGSGGVQSREVTCQKIIANGYPSIVADKECFDLLGPKPELFRSCNEDAPCPTWFIGHWKPCDKLCDEGKQTRRVTCYQNNTGRIEVLGDENCEEDKPETEQPCILQPCDGVDWVTSDWSGCDTCLSTIRTRVVVCSTKAHQVLNDSFCSYHTRPSDQEECDKKKLPPCEVQWYATQWSKCSVDCGDGVQTRKIFCGLYDGDNVDVVEDEKCADLPKYNDTKPCSVPKEECPSQWFAGPWTVCTKECGGGEQFRRVMCFRGDKEAQDCDPDTVLDSTQRCNVGPCNEDEMLPVDSKSTPIMDEEEECDYEEGDYTEEGLDSDASTPLDVLMSDSPGYGEHESTWDTGSGFGSTDDLTTIEGSGFSSFSSSETTDTTFTDTDYSTEDTESTGVTDSTVTIDKDITTKTTRTTDDTDKITATTVSVTGSSDETDTTGTGTDVTETTDSSVTDTASTSSGSVEDTDTTPTSVTDLDETSSSDTDATGSTESTATESSTSSDESSPTDSSEGSTTAGETGSTESSISTAKETGSSSEISSSRSTGTEDTESTILGETGSTESSSSTESKETGSTSESVSTSTDETTPTGETDSSKTDISGSTESSSTDETTASGSTETIITKETGSTESTITEETSSTESTITEETSTSESTIAEETSSTESTVTEETGLTESTLTSESESTETGPSGSTGSESTFDTESTEVSSTTEAGSTESGETSETTLTTSDETKKTTIDDVTTKKTTIVVSTESEATESSGSSESTEATSTSSDVESTSVSTSERSESTAAESSKSESVSTTESSTEAGSSTVETSSSGSSEATEQSSTISSELTEASTSGTDSSSVSETSTSAESPETSTTVASESTMEGGSTTEGSSTVSEESTSAGSTESTEEGSTTEAGSTLSTASEQSTTSGSTESTETGSTETGSTEVSGSTTEGLSTTEGSTTEGVSISTGKTPWTIYTVVAKKPHCKPRRKPKCGKTEFGCCPDKKTTALGPFDEGCPKPRTCKESTYGCCPDGLSPAQGDNNEGCPIEPCADTLFGCCLSDNKTAAQGNDQDGCPPPPPPCMSSEFGCCADNETEATGPGKEGCPETSTTELTTESTTETTESSETSEGTTGSEGSTDITATTLDNCAGFKYGCCADNETEAPGPDGQGCPCNTTEFGCCPDGVSPAQGVSNEGCPGACSTSEHGCCQDGQTPAHGPEFEGCCLLQAFGCCPDNRKPAEGPHLEGCGCQYSLHGCCPDNVTIAQGPDNKGCGCQYTEHGCCPDRHTPALGPNNEGCACHTYQFGCCPDGVTMAKGPEKQGCHCRDSKFGCCGDGETPATGPDAAGCDCSSSQHGCCPDGHTDAAGPKFLGCTDAPENKQAVCSLSTDPGPCHNFTAMWYYDLVYGGCSRFWYGGCDGNGNRFATKEECEDICVQPSPKDACKLPSVKGPCEGDYVRWHYNSTREQCIPFRYGGCLGNTNNFDTRDLCQKQCEPATAVGQCELPIEQGSCAGNYSRWGFNSETHRCEQFIWGGCEGNANRFSTEAACEMRCTQTPSAQCSEPQEAGNCSDKQALWSFSQSENRCVPFYYSGCGGKSNKFTSRDACEQTCPSAYEADKCTLPPEAGECPNYRERWFYDTNIKRCRQFYYGGCGGNENNFLSQGECESSCSEAKVTTTTSRPATQPQTQTQPQAQPQPEPEPERPEFCFLAIDSGPCTNTETRYAYNSELGRCVTFQYGGCGGNQNNFPDETYCTYYCHPIQDICQLPMLSGPCDESLMRWFYDPVTDSCSQFTYGGCEGNDNRFETREACESRCKTGVVATTPTTTLTTPAVATVGSRVEEGIAPECKVPEALEECQYGGEVWYYDQNSHECVAHSNAESGSGAICRYVGTFDSQEACERSCGAFRGVDVCTQEKDVGPCQTYVTKVYFDASSGQCREFAYGGCLGGANRFSSMEECKQVCIDPHRGEIDPCTQQPEQGNCLSYISQWFYDASRGECDQFIYTGCAGNDNRFESKQECESRCKSPAATTTTTAPVVPPQPSPEPECTTPSSLAPCGNNVTVFYYDSERRQCTASGIGGCGHPNSYSTEEECERRCGAFRGIDVCSARLDPGPCRASFTKFYWDAATGSCLEYAYGGCAGGPNRFSTAEECENVCGDTGPAAECLEPVDTGTEGDCGRVPAPRWHYSAERADCVVFAFGGCGGNNNNFHSYAHCAQVCAVRTRGDGSNEPADCEMLRQECETLICQYGVGRVMEDGCQRCKCKEDPCVAANCTSNERCVAFAVRDPETQEPQYSAKCVPDHETNSILDCDRYTEECSNLRCEFGVQRTHMPDGCERCACVQVEVDCRPLTEECERLKCNYGMERIVGPDNCERCKCKEHPCINTSCGEGERCVVAAYRDGIDNEPKYTADCRPITKPGACPMDETTSNEVTCRRECNDDADCRGVGKCCRRGCSDLCLAPVEQTSPHPLLTTTYAPEVPAAPISLPVQEPEVAAAEGGTATLRCLFHGNPPPKITWKRGELTIDGDAGRYRLKSDGALEIVSLYRNDTGVYICIADNGLGVAQQEIHLVVNDPVRSPVGIAGDENAVVTGELGQPLMIRCLAYGYPQPTIFWYRGYESEMVPFNDAVYQARDNILLIRSLSIDTLGQYTCQAYNGEGKAASWVVVVNAYRPEGIFLEHEFLVPRNTLPPMARTRGSTTPETTTITTTTTTELPIPMFTVPVSTHVSTPLPTLNIGADLRVTCEVDGFPDPEVYWTKNGANIRTDDRISITGSTIVSRLTVARVTVDDSGVYACHASNRYSSHSDTVQINVQQLVVPAKCTDNPFFANCDLIVRSQFCRHKYYSKFCCKSCVEAGQLDPQEAELQADQPLRKK